MPERKVRPNRVVFATYNHTRSANHDRDPLSREVVVLSLDGTPDGEVCEMLGRGCSGCSDFSVDMSVPVGDACRAFALHCEQAHPDDPDVRLGVLYHMRIDPRQFNQYWHKHIVVRVINDEAH